jgi:hypothetical protein
VTARPELTVIHGGTGEVVEEHVCQGCVQHSKTIATLSRKVTTLEKERDEATDRLPDSKVVLDILQFHKQLFPRSRIADGKSPAKTAVRELLKKTEAGEPMFTPQHLKAAALGLKWSREGDKASRPHGAAWLYADEDRTQHFIDVARGFKTQTGVSGITMAAELTRAGYEKLAAVCDCGHIRLDHEKENPAEGLWDPPCAVHGCACPGWSTAPLWEQLRWAAERDREAAMEDVA